MTRWKPGEVSAFTPATPYDPGSFYFYVPDEQERRGTRQILNGPGEKPHKQYLMGWPGHSDNAWDDHPCCDCPPCTAELNATPNPISDPWPEGADLEF